jgi:hypothetical protein
MPPVLPLNGPATSSKFQVISEPFSKPQYKIQRRKHTEIRENNARLNGECLLAFERSYGFSVARFPTPSLFPIPYFSV